MQSIQTILHTQGHVNTAHYSTCSNCAMTIWSTTGRNGI